MSFAGKLVLRLTISYEEDHVLRLSGVWLNIHGREKCLSAFFVPEVGMQLTHVFFWRNKHTKIKKLTISAMTL